MFPWYFLRFFSEKSSPIRSHVQTVHETSCWRATWLVPWCSSRSKNKRMVQGTALIHVINLFKVSFRSWGPLSGWAGGMGDWGAGEERVLFNLDGEVREEGLITCDIKMWIWEPLSFCIDRETVIITSVINVPALPWGSQAESLTGLESAAVVADEDVELVGDVAAVVCWSRCQDNPAVGAAAGGEGNCRLAQGDGKAHQWERWGRVNVKVDHFPRKEERWGRLWGNLGSLAPCLTKYFLKVNNICI